MHFSHNPILVNWAKFAAGLNYISFKCFDGVSWCRLWFWSNTYKSSKTRRCLSNDLQPLIRRCILNITSNSWIPTYRIVLSAGLPLIHCLCLCICICLWHWYIRSYAHQNTYIYKYVCTLSLRIIQWRQVSSAWTYYQRGFRLPRSFPSVATEKLFWNHYEIFSTCIDFHSTPNIQAESLSVCPFVCLYVITSRFPIFALYIDDKKGIDWTFI